MKHFDTRIGRRGRARALACASLLLVLLTACGPGEPLRHRIGRHVAIPERRVVLFLCDGIGQDYLEAAVREGRLPNIEKRFVAGGVHVQNTATCVPPITYAAIATLLTGVGPGEHTIVGNRWFDPDRSFFRDYTKAEDYRDINDDCTAATVYELMKPAVSASIQCAYDRGVTCRVANWAQSGVMWFFGDYTAVDKLTATSTRNVVNYANSRGRWPSLTTYYFPGADSVGHRCGVTSAEYREAVDHIDHQVGRVCDWLEREGLLQSAYIVLVSDHGMVDVKPDGVVDLVGLVRDGWGHHVTTHTLQRGLKHFRRAYFDKYETVLAYQNGQGAFLYFRGPAGWETSLTCREVEARLEQPAPEQRLWNVPGVQLVAYLANDNEAVLRSEQGRASVRRRTTPAGAEYAYVPDSADVLGYMAAPQLAEFVRGGYHDARAWLEATAGQDFPDFVPHAVPLLHVHRSGQVVAFTKPGYSFIRETAGHGSICRSEMRSLFMVAGPGIRPGGAIRAARSTDLVPTMLDMLGIGYDAARFEGRSLKSDLLKASETEYQNDR